EDCTKKKHNFLLRELRGLRGFVARNATIRGTGAESRLSTRVRDRSVQITRFICMTSVVVHYKELALKGKNRPWFIRLLVRNLRTLLAGLDAGHIRSMMGRIEIELGPAASWDEVRARLGRVFGVANFCAAGRSTHDFATVASAILSDLGSGTPESFRVSATRADKRLPFTSPQVEREVG